MTPIPSLRSEVCGLLSVVCCLLSLLLTSCRTVPPPDPGLAAGLVARYEAALPVHFDSRQTLLFEFRPHWWWPSVRLTALGYSTVNRKTGDYGVVCLSPLGMKLFDVARSNGQIRSTSPFPASADPKASGQAIAEDIADLMFDLTPPRGTAASGSLHGDRLVFRSTAGDQTVEYVFSATTGRLLSKARFSGGRRVNTIRFSDYREEGGRVYPAVSVLRNYRHRYRLTLTVQTLALRAASP